MIEVRIPVRCWSRIRSDPVFELLERKFTAPESRGNRSQWVALLSEVEAELVASLAGRLAHGPFRSRRHATNPEEVDRPAFLLLEARVRAAIALERSEASIAGPHPTIGGTR